VFSEIEDRADKTFGREGILAKVYWLAILNIIEVKTSTIADKTDQEYSK